MHAPDLWQWHRSLDRIRHGPIHTQEVILGVALMHVLASILPFYQVSLELVLYSSANLLCFRRRNPHAMLNKFKVYRHPSGFVQAAELSMLVDRDAKKATHRGFFQSVGVEDPRCLRILPRSGCEKGKGHRHRNVVDAQRHRTTLLSRVYVSVFTTDIDVRLSEVHEGTECCNRTNVVQVPVVVQSSHIHADTPHLLTTHDAQGLLVNGVAAPQ
mmetsp:Transcript_128053/g.239652  ORF Transcript_128053/g.239652 Transcript_128053/m.239652 type:complete len:214 (+) Transcript_128053:567-1208(+)